MKQEVNRVCFHYIVVVVMQDNLLGRCTLIDGLIVCHLPFGPTAFFALSNCVLRHDIEDVAPLSLAYPHLIFHNFTSKLGERVGVFFCFCLFVASLIINQRSFLLNRRQIS